MLYLAGRLFEEGSSSRKTLSFEITVYHLQVENGYDLFTDFSKRIILHNKNIDIFLNKLENLKNLDLQINFVACISDFLDINCYAI